MDPKIVENAERALGELDRQIAALRALVQAAGSPRVSAEPRDPFDDPYDAMGDRIIARHSPTG